MPLFVFLVFMLAAVRASAGEIGLVRPGAEWRYTAVTSEASPPAEWNLPSFDDGAWTRGISGFESRGTGYPEATRLASGDGILAYCFRTHFTVADSSYIKKLLLRIDYQHGFVAYLNGVEIARRGFAPGSPVPLDAVAARHLRNLTEVLDVTAFLGQLRIGENVLAVQLHRASEVDRDFCLVAELMANFMRAPFLQKATTNSVMLVWDTFQNNQGRVEFGRDLSNLRTVVAPVNSWRNAVELRDLEPGATYQYRVFVDGSPASAVSDWGTFRTLKMPGQPIRFAVFGDSGQATPQQYQIAEQLAQSDLDLVMHVGDVVYPHFSAAQADARCFSIYRDFFAKTPIFVAMGNHDAGGFGDYLGTFFLPTNNVDGSELFYSFDHGDARFIVLATETTMGSRYHPGSRQYQWLEEQLANSPQPWKFLFFHHVLRTSSIHLTDDYLRDGVPDLYALQVSIGALAARYGAQVVFNGHDHDYERFAMFDGVNTIISGGGGAALYPRAYTSAGSDHFHSRHHHLVVSVNGSQMQVEAIDHTGETLDRFYRSLEAGAATLYQSSWQTPIIESSAGVEDGNIPNQTFDFQGPPIPTLPGLQANLGRLRVGNDSTHLYIGLEYASIHPHQAIALFLENPRLPGISNLAPLGDGELDSMGQGADGLDLLTNLRFLNFQPSIGCLLGDELADTHLRTHRRPGMRWATGQGVFRLNQSLATIPSARLQQFNRSPQRGVQIWEQNADLIEVAIPLVELGASGEVETVRIGAVAFADGGGTSLVPVIDSAVAGRSLTRGDGYSVLEPIVVQLARDPGLIDPYDFRGRLLADNRIEFSWISTPGTSYAIQFTTDLTQPFEDLDTPGLPVTASGARTTFETAAPPGATVFFRLRALP